jgi:hypothetical protein
MNLDSPTLYEQDFYLWLEMTIELLEEEAWQKIDRKNLVEELKSMGKSEKRQLSNRLITILEHLLKLAYWQTEKEYNERGWKNTIIEQRKKIELILRDSPSLRTQLESILSECYADAQEVTWRKTGLTLPDKSPFTLEEVLNPDFFPQGGEPESDTI